MARLMSMMMTLMCLGSILTTVMWYMQDDSLLLNYKPPPLKRKLSKTYRLCTGCQEIFNEVMKDYSYKWRKQEQNYMNIKSELQSRCNGYDGAIITQLNTPLGSKITFETFRRAKVDSKGFIVGTKLYNHLPAEHPFKNKIWDTCAVVGNGGILSGSKCGPMIDSADFVFRCNLPPLDDEFMGDVGKKTSLVTANPSILMRMFGSLMENRLPFAKKLQEYGDSLVLLPAFSLSKNTDMSIRALYTLEDFKVPARVVFFNPQYLIKLANFWGSKGIKPLRLSSGLMIVSLALEVCSNVNVYGFWPYGNHPSELYPLSHHYYDDVEAPPGHHAMPSEFAQLLSLHNRGVLKLRLGSCEK
ncbi:alpha-2,8-sialyltransferase 8F-like [Neosynchiropus ocellatus]